MKKKRFFLLACMSGFVLAYYFVRLEGDASALFTAISVWDVVILAYLTLFSLYLHVLLHELGHLIGGKLTGYRLVFFQAVRMRYEAKTGSYTAKKPRGAGMLGQCLMAPPEAGTYADKPYLLYLIGGVAMNFLTGGILYATSYFLSIRWGFYMLLLSLVPLFLGLSNSYWRGYTDGNVIKEVRKSLLTKRLFFQQLELAELLENDQTFADIPESFFEPVTSGESSKSFLGEFFEMVCYRRHLAELNFEAADATLETVLTARDIRFSPYAVSIYCEKLFCDSLFGRIQAARQTHALIQRIPQLAAYYKQTKRIEAAYELFVNINLVRTKTVLDQDMDRRDLSQADQVTEKRLEDWLQSYLPHMA